MSLSELTKGRILKRKIKGCRQAALYDYEKKIKASTKSVENRCMADDNLVRNWQRNYLNKLSRTIFFIYLQLCI